MINDGHSLSSSNIVLVKAAAIHREKLQSLACRKVIKEAELACSNAH